MNAPAIPAPVGTGIIARRWPVVRAGLIGLAAVALAAAAALHPALAARYLSADGELAPSSERTLYIMGAVLAGLAAGALLAWHRWRMPTRRRERFVLGIASLAGSVLVSALAAEAGLSLVHRFVKPLGAERHYFFEYDAVLGWKHRPGSRAMFKNAVVRFDGDGLRVSGRERGPYRSRVLLLGDSQAFGDGVAAEDTFGARLEADIPGLRVLNASVIGYGTDQQLLYFEQQAARHAPDVTIIACNAYDLRDNLSTRVRSGYAKPRFVSAPDGLALTNVPVPGDGLADRLHRGLERGSHLYRLAGRMLRSARRQRSRDDDAVVPSRRLAREVYPDDAHVDRGLGVTTAILDRFAASARQAGTRLVVLFLPYQMDFGEDQTYVQHTERVVRRLADRATLAGFTFIDGRRGIPAERAQGLFLDAMHLSPTGHQQIAALLEDALGAGMTASREP